MSLEGDLRAWLSPFVGDRVWPDVAPAGTVPPYATFQQVGGDEVTFIENVPSGAEQARIQVSVWSRTRLSANDLMRNIRDEGRRRGYEPLHALIAQYDDEVNLYGAQQDYNVWFGA